MCLMVESMPTGEAALLIWHIPYIVSIDIIESVPHNPSTPSEQLVTLILIQIRTTARIPNNTGGTVTPASEKKNWI